MMRDLPANSATPIILNRLESYTGALEVLGDRDWVGVRMQANDLLEVGVQGGGLADPVMRIFNDLGEELAFSDDAGSGFDPAIRFTAPRTATYFIEVAAYENEGTGSYTVYSQEAVPIAPTQALDWGPALRSRDVSVYFAQPGETFDGFTSEGFNGYERARFEAAFDLIEAVADLSFRVQTSPVDADFRLVLDLNEDTDDFQAYFNPPGERNAGVGLFDGNQWDRAPGGDLRAGGYSFAVIVHELLHGLGMSHPHDEGGRSVIMDGVLADRGDFGRFNLNQGIFTIMSYNEGFATGTAGSEADDNHLYGHSIGPMALDIAVLQEKYGVNTTTAVKDTVYTLPTANSAGIGWRAIWDVAGVDEIRANPNDTSGVIISLRAATLQSETGGGGFYSGETGIAGGFTIANGVTIENATGGRGDDRLYGAGGDNTLRGGAGDDTLVGGGGSDHLDGGAGTDLAVVTFNPSDILAVSDSLQTQSGQLYLTVSNPFDVHTVVLSGIEQLRFANAEVMDRASLADMRTGVGFRVDGDGALMGGALNDTVAGGAGADLLDGGAGVDTLVGRGGNDFYIVDNPLDVVREDAAFSAGGGIDTIRAFVDYTQPQNVELLRLGNLEDALNLNGTGNDAPGTLVGNAGRNILTGRGGDDQINGNAGNDTLIGGVGRDTLVGGQGDDTFVYTSVSDSRAGAATRDLINGFTPFSQERIDLRQIDADTTSFGTDDAFVFIHRDLFSGQAGELRLQALGGPNAVLLEADVNGDATADFQILVTQRTVLFEDEFLL